MLIRKPIRISIGKTIGHPIHVRVPNVVPRQIPDNGIIKLDKVTVGMAIGMPVGITVRMPIHMPIRMSVGKTIGKPI
ncbi:hypothetical protein N0V85_006785 [Neurospora sp. IMI 360204]|nr:hypothetical protein N0V85_006785 [Neurospora sp. IMI 360204]